MPLSVSTFVVHPHFIVSENRWAFPLKSTKSKNVPYRYIHTYACSSLTWHLTIRAELRTITGGPGLTTERVL